MYDYISGTLTAITPESAIIDVQGVGFRILISKLCPSRSLSIGEKTRLWVELIVREDSQTLYGFVSAQERDFFRFLQQVSGIGPKMALNIIGHARIHEIVDAIIQKDAKALSSLPGVGKKLAERIIIELHEKTSALAKTEAVETSEKTKLIQAAVQALETLGFSTQEARSAVLSAHNKCPDQDIGQLVQYALAHRR